MPDLEDGQTIEVKGSAAKPYVLKNTGGVYSCTCPAWRNQSLPIEQRTCKHLRKLRGDAAEEARVGSALPQRPAKPRGDGEDGEEAAGPPLLLAHTWDSATDLSGWWMSEKLDGVRAYWDGKQFLSRLGNLFHAPDWFAEGLPDLPLDGELWIGRKAFQRTVSIVRRQDKTDLWREVRYVVFDAPAAGGGFEERMQLLGETFAARPAEFARVHEQQVCPGIECLRAELARVETLGGEGLMLREPGSKYEAGRSATLLKIKSFRDAEAVVIGRQEGAGRHKGRMGALLVRLPNGTEFSVGTGFSDREREAPPPVGAAITFRYQELTEAGVPRFPSFVGVRADVAAAGAAPMNAPGAGRAVLVSSEAAPPAAAGTVKEDRGVCPASESSGGSARAAGAEPRRFEFVGGSSAKFWEVSCAGCEMTTRWGRIGSAGQSKTKTFADESAGAAAADKLIGEKLADGYVEKE